MALVPVKGLQGGRFTMKKLVILALACLALILCHAALAEEVLYVPEDIDLYENPEGLWHLSAECPAGVLCFDKGYPTRRRLVARLASQVNQDAFKPCPVCMPDEKAYPGIEACARGGTVVVRIPDAELENLLAEGSEPATLPEELLHEGGGADSDLARLLHGQALLDALSGGEGLTLAHAAVPDPILEDGALLMSRRHLGAAWYLVVRPAEAERAAIEAGGPLHLNLDVYGVDLEIQRWWYGCALTGARNARRAEAAIEVTPKPSANRVVNENDDAWDEVATTVYLDRDVYTLVIHDDEPLANDDFLRWNATGGAYTRLRGYRSGKIGVYCMVLSESELETYEYTLGSALDEFIRDAAPDGGTAYTPAALDAPAEGGEPEVCFTSYGTSAALDKQFFWLTRTSLDRKTSTAYPIPVGSLLRTDAEGLPVVAWVDAPQIRGGTLRVGWPTSSREAVEIRLPDDLCVEVLLDLSPDHHTAWVSCLDETRTNARILALDLQSDSASAVRTYWEGSAKDLSDIQYFAAADLDHAAWFEIGSEAYILSDGTNARTYALPGDDASCPVTWIDPGTLLFWKNTHEKDYTETFELYALNADTLEAAPWPAQNGSPIGMAGSNDFPETRLSRTPDGGYAAWFDLYGWGGLTDIQVASLETGAMTALEPWPELDKGDNYVTSYRDTANGVRLVGPDWEEDPSPYQVCIVNF